MAQILLTRFFNQRIVNQCKPKAFAYAKYLGFLRFVFFVCCVSNKKRQSYNTFDYSCCMLFWMMFLFWSNQEIVAFMWGGDVGDEKEGSY